MKQKKNDCSIDDLTMQLYFEHMYSHIHTKEI